MNFKLINPLRILGCAFIAIVLSSCYSEDPGPIQEAEKDFSVIDFDRLEMGDAFHITVEQGELFDVSASGDERNINDLIVEVEGETLIIKYDEFRNRRHDTHIRIVMPTLLSATFSGASHADVTGFTNDHFKLNLSGASIAQLDIDAENFESVVSGASYLYMTGTGDNLDVELTGASVLKAFQYPVTTANLEVSGASDARIMATSVLNVSASGASVVSYRGEPAVNSVVSGASTVRKD